MSPQTEKPEDQTLQSHCAPLGQWGTTVAGGQQETLVTSGALVPRRPRETHLLLRPCKRCAVAGLRAAAVGTDPFLGLGGGRGQRAAREAESQHGLALPRPPSLHLCRNKAALTAARLNSSVTSLVPGSLQAKHHLLVLTRPAWEEPVMCGSCARHTAHTPWDGRPGQPGRF